MTTYLLLKDPLHHKSLIDLVRADDVDVAVPGILQTLQAGADQQLTVIDGILHGVSTGVDTEVGAWLQVRHVK